MENEDTAPDRPEPVLSPLEARVLGCLMEKEATTPDVYPLSLNSLVNACNQKSNRAPLMAVGEGEVTAAVDLLRGKHLVTLFSGAGARAVKYRHRFGEVWPVEPAAQAMLCELLLRGPQTAAALRGNCERLAAMPELPEVEAILGDLATRPSGALVRKLERQPGQKEGRWAATIIEGGEESAAPAGGGVAPTRATVGVELKLPAEAEGRLAALEAEVAALRAELNALKAELGAS